MSGELWSQIYKEYNNYDRPDGETYTRYWVAAQVYYETDTTSLFTYGVYDIKSEIPKASQRDFAKLLLLKKLTNDLKIIKDFKEIFILSK
jgi:hypothetical protein